MFDTGNLTRFPNGISAPTLNVDTINYDDITGNITLMTTATGNITTVNSTTIANSGNITIGGIASGTFSDVAGTIDVITGNITLTEADAGKYVFCNAADCVVTLPATASGLSYTIYTNVASAGTGTTISPAAADKIIGSGVTPADDKDLINTAATDAVGDFVKLVGDGNLGWYTVQQNGIWAREA